MKQMIGLLLMVGLLVSVVGCATNVEQDVEEIEFALGRSLQTEAESFGIVPKVSYSASEGDRGYVSLTLINTEEHAAKRVISLNDGFANSTSYRLSERSSGASRFAGVSQAVKLGETALSVYLCITPNKIYLSAFGIKFKKQWIGDSKKTGHEYFIVFQDKDKEEFIRILDKFEEWMAKGEKLGVYPSGKEIGTLVVEFIYADTFFKNKKLGETEIVFSFSDNNLVEVDARPHIIDEDISFSPSFRLQPKSVSLIKSMLAKDGITRIRQELETHVLHIENEIKNKKEEEANKEKLIEDQFN